MPDPDGSTVLFWNIRAGGGPSRAQAVLLEILSHEPDTVALCECRSSFAGQLAASLRDHGLTHALRADAPPRVNRVLLLSRNPITPGRTEPDPRLLHARVGDTLVTACHIPDASQRRRRLETLARVHELARCCRDEPHLILGDFNADRAHRPARDGRAIGALAALGYADLWLRAGGDPAEPTWSGNGRAAARIDHAYASKPLVSQAQTAHQIHAPRIAGWSDHSLMKLRLIHKRP